MSIELRIDRAIYSVDDATRTYRFLGRNPDWHKLDAVENEFNKRRIDGYTRVFRDGTKRRFRFRK
jgi:hypothetical protein